MKDFLAGILVLLCFSSSCYADFTWPECPQPTVEGYAKWYALSSEGYLGVRTGNYNYPPAKEELFDHTYLVDVDQSCEFVPAVLAITQTCHNFLEENDAGYSAILAENIIHKDEVSNYQAETQNLNTTIKEQALIIKKLKRKIARLKH